MSGPRHFDDGHGEWDALAVGWAMSALDPEDEAIFLPHLAVCDRCTELVAETTLTVGDIGFSVPDEAPPPELKDRLMAAVRSEPRGVGAPPGWAPPPPPVPQPPVDPRRQPPAWGGPPAAAGPEVVPLAARRSRRWVPLTAAAAAAALVVGLGGWNVKLRGDASDLRGTLAQRDNVLSELTRPGVIRIAQLTKPDSDTPVGMVVTRADGIDVLADGLGPTGGASQYWLWALDGPDDRAPTPIGGFDVTGNGPSIQVVGPGRSNLEAPLYAISSEPRGSHPTKPTGPILGAGASH
jgi:Anti-sigma-K factor rskA